MIKVEEWNQDDATYLRTMFGQPSGQKFLRIMRLFIPKVTAKKLEEVQIEALIKQGAENLFDNMMTLAQEIDISREETPFRDFSKDGD